MSRADVKVRLFNVGLEVVGSAREELGAFVKAEMTKWGKVTKQAAYEERDMIESMETVPTPGWDPERICKAPLRLSVARAPERSDARASVLARSCVLACVSGILMLGIAPASAQNFPTRPVRIITGGAGGGNDIAARLIAAGLTMSFGQQVIVDNRPSGFIPGETVATAKPDGYTIVLSGRSHWIAPLTVDKPPYDPLKDFATVTLPASTPNVLAVHPSLPVQSVKGLIALAKAKPGELNYGASGVGSGPHLAGELFKSMAKVDIVRINYKAMGAVYTDLMAGQVQIAFGSAPGMMPLVQSGRLRGLAVTSAKPSALAPGMPPIATTGLPGYDFTSPFGIFAPAETPRPIVNRLNEEIVKVLHRPEVKEKFFNAGMEVVGSTPDQLAVMVKADMEKFGKIVKDRAK